MGFIVSGDWLDPLQELDDLVNNPDTYDDYHNQFSILGASMPSDDEDHSDHDDDHDDDNDDGIRQSNAVDSGFATTPSQSQQQQPEQPQQQQQQRSSPQQRKGLLWPYIQPRFESVYMAVTYGIFLLLFLSKELVYSLFAFADMACFALIANSCMFVLKLFGFYKDRDYINPRRMLLSEDDTDQGKVRMVFRIMAGVIYAVILSVLLFGHKEDITAWRSDVLSNRSSQAKGVHNARQNVELFRDAIISVLPSWIPLDPDTGRIDSQELMETMDDRYMIRQAQSPDFALATLGSRVLVRYTTASFDKDSKRGWRYGLYRFIRHRSFFHSSPSSSPVMALLPDTHPGQCWPMAGQYGSLGVRLSQRISVNAVSIDHVDPHQAIDMSSAPKDFEVWGLTTQKPTGTWKYPWDPAASIRGEAVYLGKFKYNIGDNATGPVQTFKLKTDSPPLRDIVFRFLSNWDKDEFTCIYRVRVHGNLV